MLEKSTDQKNLENITFCLIIERNCLDFLTSLHDLYNSMKDHVLPSRSIGLAFSFYCKHVVSDHVQIWIPFFDFWTDSTNNSYSATPVRFCISINFKFYYIVSDFGNTTYQPQNRTSFMDVP